MIYKSRYSVEMIICGLSIVRDTHLMPSLDPKAVTAYRIIYITDDKQAALTSCGNCITMFKYGETTLHNLIAFSYSETNLSPGYSM